MPGMLLTENDYQWASVDAQTALLLNTSVSLSLILHEISRSAIPHTTRMASLKGLIDLRTNFTHMLHFKLKTEFNKIKSSIYFSLSINNKQFKIIRELILNFNYK